MKLVDLVGDFALVKKHHDLFLRSIAMFLPARDFEDVSFLPASAPYHRGYKFRETAGQVFVNFRSKVPLKGNQLGHRKPSSAYFTAARGRPELEFAEFLYAIRSMHPLVPGHTDR